MRSRRRPRMQLAVVLMLVAALLSLGPYLAIDGRLTDIPLPFLAAGPPSPVQYILPSRISLGVDACLAAVIAFGLDDMRRAPEPRSVAEGVDSRAGKRCLCRRDPRCAGRHPIATVAGLIRHHRLLRSRPHLRGPFQPEIRWPSPTRMTHVSEPADALAGRSRLQFPPARGLRLSLIFRLPAASVAPTETYEPPRPQQFLADQEGVNVFGPALRRSPKLVAITRSVVSRYHIRLVIVDRSMAGSGAVMELFNDALGTPVLSAGQFSMWANWHGRPSHEQFSPHIVTSVIRPANDATVSGTAVLDAGATASRDQSRVPPH